MTEITACRTRGKFTGLTCSQLKVEIAHRGDSTSERNNDNIICYRRKHLLYGLKNTSNTLCMLPFPESSCQCHRHSQTRCHYHCISHISDSLTQSGALFAYVPGRVGVDYKSPITITVPIKLSITITVVIEKAITITITITIIRLRLQLLVYHGNDSRLFIRHVHLQYYHA